MSLEAAIAENTAVNKELLAVTQKLLDLRTEAIETVRTAAAPAKAAAKAKPAAAETPAAETPPAAAEKPAATETPELNPVQASIAAYVGQEGISAEERAARSEKVKVILGKVGAAKASDVPAEKGPAVIKAMETLLSQGNILADAPAEDDLLAA